MRSLKILGAASVFAWGALLSMGSPALAASATLSVPGTSNPFLAGQPTGGPYSSCCSGDSVPGDSPVYAGAVTGGNVLTFTNVSGSVSYAGGVPTDPPSGDPGYLVDTSGYEPSSIINNIAGYDNAPIDALIGVFLNAQNPATDAVTPTVLDFSSPTLTPGLQEVFYIGDGGSSVDFTVPTGATRLYLGTVDGFGWDNNSGAILVTVNGLNSAVPEPTTWAMMILGAGAVGALMRRRRTGALAVA